MDLNALKISWEAYCIEKDSGNGMDIEQHIEMASKVGELIGFLEKSKLEKQQAYAAGFNIANFMGEAERNFGDNDKENPYFR